MKLKYIMALHVAASICIYSAEAELQAPKNRTAIFIGDYLARSPYDPVFTTLLRAIGEAENPIIIGAPLFNQFAQSVRDYKKCVDTNISILCTKIRTANLMLDKRPDENYKHFFFNTIQKFLSAGLESNEKFSLNSYIFTNFDQDDWIIKKATDDDILTNEVVLLIPKKYLEKIGASGLTGRALDMQVGFKISHLPDINVMVPEDRKSVFGIATSFLLKRILDSLFVTKTDLAAGYNAQNYNWYFYLFGHGYDLTTLPLRDESKRAEFFETLNSLNAQIASMHFTAPNNFKPELLLKDISDYQAGTISAPNLTKIIYKQGIHYDQNSNFNENIKQLKSLLAKMVAIESQSTDSNDYNIAGLRIKNFTTLLDFFNEKINTTFLFYSSCYSGGASAVIPHLGKSYNYTIVSNSIGNTVAHAYGTVEVGKIQIKTTNKNRNRFVLTSESIKINDLFSGLITKKQSLAKTFAEANVAVKPTSSVLQYVFVRYKNTQSFVPFIQTKHTNKVITLNKTLIQSYLATNRQIRITIPTMVLVYSTFIPIPITILSDCYIVQKLEGEPLAIQEVVIPYRIGIRDFLYDLKDFFIEQNNSLILIRRLIANGKIFKNVVLANNSSYLEADVLKRLDPENNYKIIVTDSATNETLFYGIKKDPSLQKHLEIATKTLRLSSSQAAEINDMFDNVYEKQVRASNLSPEIARAVAANIATKKTAGPRHLPKYKVGPEKHKIDTMKYSEPARAAAPAPADEKPDKPTKTEDVLANKIKVCLRGG